MAPLDLLTRPRDPSRTWVAAPGFSPEVNLDAAALGGCAPGAFAAPLAELGRAPEWRALSGPGWRSVMLGYPARGLQVTVSGTGLLRDWRAVFAREFWPASRPEFSPFAGAVLLRGRPLGWSAATPESAVVAALGAPRLRDDDIDGPLLEYGLAGATLEIEFLRDGALARIGAFAESEDP